MRRPVFQMVLWRGVVPPPRPRNARGSHGPQPLCPGCAPCPLPRGALMTPPSWIRKLFARTPRTVRKAPARRPALEALEDRLTPATLAVTPMTGADNPWNGVSLGGYSTPAFGDVDGDGDLDALVGGNSDGTL